MTDWRYSFRSLENTIQYFVRNEVATSDTFRITCMDAPFVKRWEVRYTDPSHTGMGSAVDTLHREYGSL